jgi:hypothetical protein
LATLYGKYAYWLQRKQCGDFHLIDYFHVIDVGALLGESF